MSDQKKDRGTYLLMLLSMATFAVLALTAIVTIPSTLSANDNSSEVVKGNELAGCRSEASVLVTKARSALDHANHVVLDLQAEAFEVAIGGRNEERLQAIGAALPAARRAANDADMALAAQTSAYDQVVKLSRQDPVEFAKQCRAGFVEEVTPDGATTTSSSTTPPLVTPTSARQRISRTTTTGTTAVTVPRSTSSTFYSSTTTTRPSLCELLPITIPEAVRCP